MKKRFRRQHLRANGVAKVSYPSEAEARDAGVTLGHDAYRCGHCGLWHLGGWAPKNLDKDAPARVTSPGA